MIPLRDENRVSTFPFWVIVILVINIYVFYLELTAPSTEAFILQYAFVPGNLNLTNLDSLLPLITSQFLHGGFIHIISNMIFLWVFGDNVEAALGFLLFPFFYLLGGIVAALTQFVFTPGESIPMLGASGAVAGILGAYFALFPSAKVKTLVFIFFFITLIDVPAYILLFYWFITQLFSGFLSISLNTSGGGIAFLPHVGGFLFGWISALVLFSRRKTTYPKLNLPR